MAQYFRSGHQTSFDFAARHGTSSKLTTEACCVHSDKVAVMCRVPVLLLRPFYYTVIDITHYYDAPLYR